MAILKLYRNKLQHNFDFLKNTFEKNNIEWGVVTKLLCGTRKYLELLLEMGIREMHDTRISNIRLIKEMQPDVQTVYIKPPAKRSIPSIVRYADVSFNTEYKTIKLLSDEAVLQNKLHKIIIMVEMGDLREGVMGDQLTDFYGAVFSLPNIQIIGIGTNLNCLNGVMPNQDKLIQLCLYKQLIEVKFNHHIPWISGGTSVTLSLMLNDQIPAGVNHFRIGEALFFGNDLFSEKTFEGMVSDIFMLEAQIIEVNEKPVIPSGDQKENVAGYIPTYEPEDVGRSHTRAILDVGLLDINPAFLRPQDESLIIIEASSDMLVLDLGENDRKYTTGDFISFHLRYMGALTLLNSFYVEKVIA